MGNLLTKGWVGEILLKMWLWFKEKWLLDIERVFEIEQQNLSTYVSAYTRGLERDSSVKERKARVHHGLTSTDVVLIRLRALPTTKLGVAVRIWKLPSTSLLDKAKAKHKFIIRWSETHGVRRSYSHNFNIQIQGIISEKWNATFRRRFILRGCWCGW